MDVKFKCVPGTWFRDIFQEMWIFLEAIDTEYEDYPIYEFIRFTPDMHFFDYVKCPEDPQTVLGAHEIVKDSHILGWLTRRKREETKDHY